MKNKPIEIPECSRKQLKLLRKIYSKKPIPFKTVSKGKFVFLVGEQDGNVFFFLKKQSEDKCLAHALLSDADNYYFLDAIEALVQKQGYGSLLLNFIYEYALRNRQENHEFIIAGAVPLVEESKREEYKEKLYIFYLKNEFRSDSSFDFKRYF